MGLDQLSSEELIKGETLRIGYFSQNLETFKSLCFISDGFKILKPKELQMIPYYKNFFNRKDNKNEK